MLRQLASSSTARVAGGIRSVSAASAAAHRLSRLPAFQLETAAAAGLARDYADQAMLRAWKAQGARIQSASARNAVPQHLTDQHNMLHWGKPLRDLLTCEAIYPKLQDLLGQNFRLDHIYAKVHRPGSGGGGLHEIGISGGGMYAYRYGMNSDGGGRFQNGMVVVAFELEDVHPGDGGLGVRRPFICTLRFC